MQMEELCKKLHTVVFVSDVGHPCQRGDVCEVAPILQSHNALQIYKFGAEKGGWAPLKSASRAQACMSWDRETVFPKPKTLSAQPGSLDVRHERAAEAPSKGHKVCVT